ncbi:MAG: CoA-binding protein [Gemmobacter sp.]
MTDPGSNTFPTDDDLSRILRSTRVIAVVGVSANPLRPSFFVARYLTLRGFRVIPVNPGIAGQTLFGEEVRSGIDAIPPEVPVDMVDIFRRSEEVPPLVEQAIGSLPALRTVWMQIGVQNAEAAALAQSRGIAVIQNRCPKIEYQRLFGELRMGGFATGIISSRV